MSISLMQEIRSIKSGLPFLFLPPQAEHAVRHKGAKSEFFGKKILGSKSKREVESYLEL